MSAGPLSRIRAAWWLYVEALGPGLLFGLPLGFLVGSLWGHRPGMDAALWEPGGYHLVETARLLGRDLGALVRAAPWLLFAWGVLGLIPQALALAALRPGRRRGSERVAIAVEALPALGLVLGVTVLARVVLALLCVALSRGLEPALAGASDPGRAAGQAALVALGLGLMGLARVWHDLSSVAAVRWGERGRDALVTGLGVLHRRFGSSVGAWAWRSLIGALGAAVAALVGGRWHAGLGLWAAAAVHQVGLAALAWMRAGWLVRAWELSGEVPRYAPDGDRGDEADEPRGPEVAGEAAMAPLTEEALLPPTTPDEQGPSTLEPGPEPSQDTPPKV